MISTDDGRAVTNDGVNWQVQLWRAHELLQWGGMGRPEIRWGYLVAGVWSRAIGFDRFPVDPTLDVVEIEVPSQRLIAHVEQHCDGLPFAPADNLELWLLDHDEHLPLALLASTRERRNCDRASDACWRASLPGDLSFVSDTLSQHEDFARQLHRGSSYHRDAIAALVNHTAGKPPLAQWFERGPQGDGTGLGGIHLDTSLVGRCLSREMFPELLLREHWPDSRVQSLVHDFHRWQAPLILTLSQLSRATRAFWEPFASTQAELVARFHRLYPVIVDEQLINAALVEAAIRRATR